MEDMQCKYQCACHLRFSRGTQPRGEGERFNCNELADVIMEAEKSTIYRKQARDQESQSCAKFQSKFEGSRPRRADGVSPGVSVGILKAEDGCSSPKTVMQNERILPPSIP
ncbi:unnamed protein product [Rangifer tarandus platyrhynchus]|uniref:Uncharacterized protein n=2 Tax=Rangifer tarandus platyrhynchus TaxID=3082113 RepID=A0AC59YKP5_RANTA|nr:unnamed protein product [Rangifer tarandus platyrhynchus]